MTKSIRMFLIFAMGLFLSAGLAAAGETQTGEIRAKDLSQSTVTVVDRVYKVTSGTEIIDQKGKKITLAQLPVGSDPNGGSVLFVEFVASGDEMEKITIREMPQ